MEKSGKTQSGKGEKRVSEMKRKPRKIEKDNLQ